MSDLGERTEVSLGNLHGGLFTKTNAKPQTQHGLEMGIELIPNHRAIIFLNSVLKQAEKAVADSADLQGKIEKNLAFGVCSCPQHLHDP